MKAGKRAEKKHFQFINILKYAHIAITILIVAYSLILWLQYKSIFECGRFIKLAIFTNLLISSIFALKNID